jgi:hypothetical protein
MDPDAGGNSTKKSLARTLAVICEGPEEIQEVPSLPGIRGKRFARTTTSDTAQTHAATHCTRVRRRGRGIRSDSIGIQPREGSLPTPFYTRGAERASRQHHTCVFRAQWSRSRFNTASGLRGFTYCLP